MEAHESPAALVTQASLTAGVRGLRISLARLRRRQALVVGVLVAVCAALVGAEIMVGNTFYPLATVW